MSIPRNAELRELEILRGLDQGAQTYTDLLRHSSYECVSSVKRICLILLRQQQVRMWRSIKPRVPYQASMWKTRTPACHYALTPTGKARLEELEQSYAARSADVAS